MQAFAVMAFCFRPGQFVDNGSLRFPAGIDYCLIAFSRPLSEQRREIAPEQGEQFLFIERGDALMKPVGVSIHFQIEQGHSEMGGEQDARGIALLAKEKEAAEIAFAEIDRHVVFAQISGVGDHGP